MKKPSKKDIIDGIQFFVMLYTMTIGFWYTYIFAWYRCRLPMEWWALATMMVLALLSLFGFCQWVTKRGAGKE